MSEFLAKWAAAAFLLGFAWRVRRSDRRRGIGLFLAAFALLAFEAGAEESLLEIACAALLVLEVVRLPRGPDRLLLGAGVLAVGPTLLYFALRPWLPTFRSIV